MSELVSSGSASDDLRSAAEDQLAREVEARQVLARGCGLALAELAAGLEAESVELDPDVDPLGVALLAFAARGRRLLRSAYKLLDAGDISEAVPLIRVLTELGIVGSWLKKNPDRLADWAIHDLGRRDLVYTKVIGELKDDPESQELLAEGQRELAAYRTERLAEMSTESEGVPSVEVMATEIGAGFGYQLAYRTQSQMDVHATPLAADSMYERLESGRLRLRPAPVHALSQFDQYALAAHALRDLLAITNAHLPGLMWQTGLEGITSALEHSRESDPRKEEDPALVLLQRARLIEPED